MSGYTDLDKIENSRSCLRRIARHDEQQFSKDSIVNVMEKFVKTVNQMDETILVPCRLMDRQVGDSTDIVQAPSKNSTSNQLTLNNTFDCNGKAHKKRSKNIHEFLNSAELFNLYTTLNSLKNDLLWNRTDDNEEDEGINRSEENSINNELSSNSGSTNSLSSPASSTSSSSNTSTTIKGHVRRPSTASMTSTTSVSNLSDSESEISNENDSGVESEGNCGNSQKGVSSKTASTDKATELARQCRRHLAGLYHCLEQMTEASNYLTARYQNDIGPV
ncbi:metabotropic glutamate receptor-like protein P [Episyrphus balteatus]|uniref:metabotropic glutamate receptor-like protein P n=1 Tax=Episyrphus balteatus TaxID=286459 RepID=UPI002486C8D9|nr:metabotropic glutamate receptor-like protein P [Episyrphus balteatus]